MVRGQIPYAGLTESAEGKGKSIVGVAEVGNGITAVAGSSKVERVATCAASKGVVSESASKQVIAAPP